MVKVRCIRCTGIAEGKTATEAAQKIDHAIGLSKGRPCAGGDEAPIEVIGGVTAAAAPKVTAAKAETSKPKIVVAPKTSKPKSKKK